MGEAVGLSCEGMSEAEAQFHYTLDTLGPDTRVRDHLRCHYPPGDWGPQADLMVSVLRPGFINPLEG